MPHLHLEYTANLPELNVDLALLRCNQALVAPEQFGDEFDIKSRAIKLDTFRVGTGIGERGFVAVRLSMLSGRSTVAKNQLSQSLLAILQDLGPWPVGVEVQLSVEVLDNDRDTYKKLAIGR